MAAQLSKLSEFEDASCLSIWFERVASAANPADGPSRNAVADLPSWLRVAWPVDSLADM